MPEEKIYRPERKPIVADDLTDAASNQDMLARAEEMRKMAAVNEMAEESPQQRIPQQPMPDSGLQISGNVPPEFARMMAERGHPQMQQSSQPPQQRPAPRQRPMVAANEDLHIATDTRYQDIIRQIKPLTANYEPVYLPSRGKFYDGTDGPQDGVVHVRPMTGQEEEILATPRFVKKGQAINMIFSKCMQENFNTEKFLTVDRTYLLIYLRGISYSPEYDVEVKCPECDRKFAYTIDLNDLYVDQCPDDFGLENLSGTLPTTGLEFKYRLSRGADEQMIQDYRERKMRGLDTAGQADDTLLYRTSVLLTEIAGLTDHRQIQMLLKQLPISDVAHLRNVCSEPPFGVDTNVDIYCPSCLHDFSVDLPLEANFFFPRGRKNHKK
jgi:hypothetical protein